MKKLKHIIMLVASILIIAILANRTFFTVYMGVQPMGGILIAINLGLLIVAIISIVKLVKK